MTDTVFDFHRSGEQPVDDQSRVVHMPPDVSDKQTLFRVFATQLHFPDYFGFNWDALDECLADLSWFPSASVCIWHEDLPMASNPVEARKYLRILRSVVVETSETSKTTEVDDIGGTRVYANFPEACKKDIQSLLA